MTKSLKVILFLIFTSANNLYAQDKTLHFDYLTVKEGLPQNTVLSIVKDKYGFMWFGTWNGLCRYDGYNFHVYISEPNDTNTLINNRIHFIFKDKDGTLWISSFDSIICRYNYETDNFTRFRQAQLPKYLLDSTNRRKNASYSHTSNLTIAWRLRTNVLWQTNVKTNESFSYSSGISNNSSLNDDFVHTLYKDNCDILWIGTSKGGVNKADLRGKPFSNKYLIIREGNNLTNTPVKAVWVHNNDIWLGTNSKGIVITDRNQSSQKNIRAVIGENRILSNNVRVIYGDCKGDVWIGYRSGLDKYDSNLHKFINYFGLGPNEKHPNYSIFTITEDNNHVLWIGINNGILSYDREEDQFLFHNLSKYLKGSNAMCMMADKKNNLWIGSEKGGVLQIKRALSGLIGIDTFIYTNNPGKPGSLSDNRVYTLFEDEFNNIWAGTSNGLCKINPFNHIIKTYTKEHGLSDQYISKILGDFRGNLWISHKKGISKLDIKSEIIKNYTIKNGYQGYEFLDGSGYRDPKTGELFFGSIEGYVSFHPEQITDNPFPPKIVFTAIKVENIPININQKIKGRIILKKSMSLTKEIELTYNDRSFSIEFAALHYSSPENNKYAYILEGFDKDWIFTDASIRTASYSHLPQGTYYFKVKAANCDGVWAQNPAILKIVVLPPWWKTWWAYSFYILFLACIVYLIYGIIIARENYKRQILFERLKAEKIQELDQMKMQFFTGISHEFRTPLSLIIDPLEKLANEDISQKKARYYYEIMLRNANRLLKLINQMLDFRKIEAGNLKSELSNGDIIDCIKSVFDSFQYQALERNINYTFHTRVNTMLISFDPDKSEKILYNLISNAFKYTHNKGEITVSISEIENRSDVSEKKSVEITVTDNGIGIPADSINKIFDLFYQVEDSPRYKGEGSGIGLALVKELVTLCQGKITVESEVGNGTSFRVTLPVYPLQDEAEWKCEKSSNISEAELTVSDETLNNESESVNMPQPAYRPIILLVEDNEDVRSYVKNELSLIYEVEESSNGIDGYEKAVTSIPDLIISDIMMPGMDGIELCRKLKSTELTSHIPVILLTARQSEQHVIQGYDTGADAYITKPFSTNVLRAHIKNLIESRQKLRELFGKGSVEDLKKIVNNTTDEAFINRAVGIVEKHLSETEFDVEKLAAMLKMSRAQLYRKIKALTNQTVHEFILIIRLNKASELLLTGEFTIAEVSWKIGFTEQANFSRSFVKQFGQNPSSFISDKKKK